MSPSQQLSPASGIEALESRIAPAFVTVGTAFNYVDADGDIVRVVVSGTAGSAEFLNAASQDLSNVLNTGDIDTIEIQGASADFAITFADTNAAVGGNVVELGEISGVGGARVNNIRGLFTIDSSASVTYNLQGYAGTGFSSGGGITLLGSVTDGSNAFDLDIFGLAANTTLFIRDNVAAGAVIDTLDIRGSLVVGNTINGTVNVDNVFGTFDFGTVAVGATVDVLNVFGQLRGNSTATGAHIDIASITRFGEVLSAGELDLEIAGSVFGSIESGGTTRLDVGGSIVNARINSSISVIVENTRSIVNSQIIAQDTVDVTVAGSVVGSTLMGHSDFVGDVGGSVINSTLSGGTSSVTLDVVGSVINSRIFANSNVSVTVGGAVVRSSIISQSSSVTVEAGGSVIASTLASGASMDVTVGGSVVGSRFTSGEGTLEMDVTGSVLNSNLVSASSSIDLIAGGSVIRSSLNAGTSMTLEVAGSVLSSRLVAGDDVDVDAVSLLSTPVIAGDNVALNLTGSLRAPVYAGGNATINVDGSVLAGSRIAATGDLTLDVDGSIGTARSTVGIRVGDDVLGFSVGGNLYTRLNAVGDFLTSDSALNGNVVGGVVGRATVLAFGGNFGDASTNGITIGGAFGGRLEVAGDLLNDLTIGGSANSLNFGGGIGPATAGANAIADIVVNGRLNFLKSASFFNRLSATTGNFQTGDGVVTGTLNATGGAPTVLPVFA